MAATATTDRGYSCEGYAASLAEFGEPRRLPRSRGWLLERPISGEPLSDLMGPYPLFDCEEWPALDADLAALDRGLVSVVVVADPLAEVGERELARAFPDHLIAFKRHFIRDLDAPAELPSHHRRHLRRATRAVDVEICRQPLEHLEDWGRLYGRLAARHGLTGIRAFSREAFRRQLALPGMLATRAVRNDRTVGMTLWLQHGARAHYHLGASSPAGYAVSASYALFDAALRELRARGVRRVDLGGSASGGWADDGLSRFKRGWANDERTAYLAGRILDRRSYERLAADRSVQGSEWFPAYRAADPDMGGR